MLKINLNMTYFSFHLFVIFLSHFFTFYVNSSCLLIYAKKICSKNISCNKQKTTNKSQHEIPISTRSSLKILLKKSTILNGRGRGNVFPTN